MGIYKDIRNVDLIKYLTKQKDWLVKQGLDFFKESKNRSDQLTSEWEIKVRERTIKTMEAKKIWEAKQVQALKKESEENLALSNTHLNASGESKCEDEGPDSLLEQ